MWHVSSRSGVATVRTAIHLLLTYLLTYSSLERQSVVVGRTCASSNVHRLERRHLSTAANFIKRSGGGGGQQTYSIGHLPTD